MYTNRLPVKDTGVVAMPAGYRWSVETSWRGLDVHGRDLPDTRVMLRLHNPEIGFSALTAQMDLATAARLHHDLGQIIIKKLQDPSYQDRSPGDSPRKAVPAREIIGVDADGVAILRDVDDLE